MARYSEKRISYQEQERLMLMLSRVLAVLKTDRAIHNFLKDLLNRQERLMLVRRLLIAELLARGETYEQIFKKLGASSGTVAKVDRRLNFGRKGLLAGVLAKRKLLF